MSQPDTKTRILDSAEQLFAKDGFHNTSTRAITSAADVNLAAVNYHFGSKDALLQAVFERRLLPLNQVRTERLEQVLDTAENAGHPPTSNDLMHAFIDPTMAFREADPGNRAFLALIGRSMAEMDSTVRDCFIHLVDPIFQLLFGSLQKALPEIPKEILLLRLQFAIGSMAHTMMMPERATLEITKKSGLIDTKKISNGLVQFICAGLEAPC